MGNSSPSRSLQWQIPADSVLSCDSLLAFATAGTDQIIIKTRRDRSGRMYPKNNRYPEASAGSAYVSFLLDGCFQEAFSGSILRWRVLSITSWALN
jgi:hypothetical protein